MATNGVIDHGSSRASRWLEERRFRIALWIAVVEGVVVAIAADVSRWTVIVVAILALALYLAAGRSLRPGVAHQVIWIFAFSQALAVVVTILSFFVFWLALVVAAVFAVVALWILFNDR
jgi:hypothetical protein